MDGEATAAGAGASPLPRSSSARDAATHASDVVVRSLPPPGVLPCRSRPGLMCFYCPARVHPLAQAPSIASPSPRSDRRRRLFPSSAGRCSTAVRPPVRRRRARSPAASPRHRTLAQMLAGHVPTVARWLLLAARIGWLASLLAVRAAPCCSPPSLAARATARRPPRTPASRPRLRCPHLLTKLTGRAPALRMSRVCGVPVSAS